MANNIDIKFSGQVELRAAKYLYKNVGDPDCLRAVLTNFYNSAYSYNTANVSFSASSNPDNAFDRDENSYSFLSSNSTITLNTHRIRPHAIVIKASSHSTLAQSSSITLSGFNEANSQFTINATDSYTLPANNDPQTFVFEDLHLKSKSLRKGWVDDITFSVGNQDMRIYQFYIYGEVIRKDLGKLPSTFGATTIESFTDSFLEVSNLNEGTLSKNGPLLVENRKAFDIARINLTSTYTIPDDAESSVLNFLPNGSDRQVNLPRAPVFNHYIKINNLDGNYNLEIRDSDRVTVVQNLSTVAGPNTLEAVWTGDQWIVTA